MKKHLPEVRSFHLMARRDAYEDVRLPREKVWYHGGSIDGAVGPIYLTPIRAMAETHAEATGGIVYEFRMRDGVVWGDIELSVDTYADMDSIGSRPPMIQKAKNSGADVVWDFEDYQKHAQVFVVSPDILEQVAQSDPLASRVAHRHLTRCGWFP